MPRITLTDPNPHNRIDEALSAAHAAGLKRDSAAWRTALLEAAVLFISPGPADEDKTSYIWRHLFGLACAVLADDLGVAQDCVAALARRSTAVKGHQSYIDTMKRWRGAAASGQPALTRQQRRRLKPTLVKYAESRHDLLIDAFGFVKNPYCPPGEFIAQQIENLFTTTP